MPKETPSERLRRSWITRRKNGNAAPYNKSTPPPKRELENLYYTQKQSTWKMAEHYGVSQRLVRNWLIRSDIRPRNYSEASRLTLNGFGEGKTHPLWKGNSVSYSALHSWVRKHKGTPQQCEHCRTTEPLRYEWANVSRRYKRNLNDWIRLCPSCHRLYDNAKANQKAA